MFRLAFLLATLAACASLKTKPNAQSGTFGVLAEHRMSQPEAEIYCASRGMHLPTSREFALYAIEMGAKGIWQGTTTPPPSAGYYKVDSINPGKQRDVLYFNHEGYDVARGGLAGELIWTSSIVPDHPDFAHVFYGDWGGGGGKPEEHRRSVLNTVRCLPNR